MTAPFIGVQLGSHSVFDEGPSHVLETLSSRARVNAVFLYSHNYSKAGIQDRPSGVLADHGQGTKAAMRRLTHRWANVHEEYFRGGFLRDPDPGDAEYAGKDVFDEIADAARERGVAVYGRMLEGFDSKMPAIIANWTKVLAVDAYGRKTSKPCANNPEYLSWMVATIEDVVASHDLDGFKYGSERSGPLSQVLLNGAAPECFCVHCLELGTLQGIDVERAREGFIKLHQWALQVQRDGRPVDGAFATFLGVLMQYPEILEWQRLWYTKMTRVQKSVYGAAKTIDPDLQVGWHVWHGVTWDPFHQAETDYSEMAEYSDWIKPVVYHDIAGVRFREWLIEPLQRTVFGDQDPVGVRATVFELLGYDSKVEAPLNELDTTGMSIDYVWREIRRSVLATGDRAAIYAGVGFDVPTNGNPMRSAPERVEEAVYRSFQAGATGMLISREYDEMRMENLDAVGRAVDRAQEEGLTR